ncbi:glycine dehydrogenase subunit 2 [Phakopsora pachyrhizi]|uniref:glycine dehydrogenase (aminomethyl-transferring) n=1 Tax=Phakopsora pachyrhizi TaxID=170000 RepID=A0AAV0B4N9_PHAPC|nr:glycine dehydrogenase subunit 2 [Phakopsora pachyrhizi]
MLRRLSISRINFHHQAPLSPIRSVPIILSSSKTGQIQKSSRFKTFSTGLINPNSNLNSKNKSPFESLDRFTSRHIGPRDHEIKHMLNQLGFDDLDQFVDQVVPQSIRTGGLTDSDLVPLSESQLIKRANELAMQNVLNRNFIGMGYHNSMMPAAIARNITENPAWYTSYTPYQPEISQGRLESLINYQTMVSSLTGLPIANASLLDEGTAAAEAMTLSFNNLKSKRKTYLVDRSVYPQTISVLRSRAEPAGINLIVTNVQALIEQEGSLPSDTFGVLVQYPERRGDITDWAAVAEETHRVGAFLTCATDLLALTKIKPPGEWGADIAIGNSARFGVPLGYGGPHAAFFAVKESLTRKIPGRLIGVSKDSHGRTAYRLALQTREQHIRRDKALSNVCTAQALLANLSAFYAVYHGPGGLLRIADKVHALAQVLNHGLKSIGYEVVNESFFDRLTVNISGLASSVVISEALQRSINLRQADGSHVGITLDESHSIEDVLALLNLFVDINQIRFHNRPNLSKKSPDDPHFTTQSVLDIANDLNLAQIATNVDSETSIGASTDPYLSSNPTKIPTNQSRQSKFLEHPVFNTHHSETELMRYIYSLQKKDLSLVDSMIPLGSCTMKLNSATSMLPFGWSNFAHVHPFAPLNQAKGYAEMIKELEEDLCKITGFPSISLQPNSGAQGEFAGLSVIRAYHHSRGEHQREICLVPVSAHGTNPASAIMAGMKVIPIKTTKTGELDLEDLELKASSNQDRLAAIMITYPSTYGVFEPRVTEVCEIVHKYGGQVYLDGANMNAQIGLTNPVKCGADVCHLNLHKTFGIPHGGGGPGVGPIGVQSHLSKFLPSHSIIKNCGGTEPIRSVSSSPWGSASILSISWSYIKMLGGKGLSLSSKIALLNANYMAFKLKDHYDLKYTNENGYCAHEFILDFGEFERTSGVRVMDIAKRLIDYGFHPPTCSWPISSAMLIEPTESESLKELDRFIESMIKIREELKDARKVDMIKNSPHCVLDLIEGGNNGSGDEKKFAGYSKEEAVYPMKILKENKFWPSVGRIDDAYDHVVS